VNVNGQKLRGPLTGSATSFLLPLSLEKKAAERNVVEIVTPRDVDPYAQPDIPPREGRKRPDRKNSWGGMKRTIEPSTASAGRFRPSRKDGA
jgi:hypothetical protein